MESVKEIIVSVKGLNPESRFRIISRMDQISPSYGTVYANNFSKKCFFCIDDEGDIDDGNLPDSFTGNIRGDFPIYTPEEFWQTFGRQDSVKLKPEDLEFGQVIHVKGRSYAFIKQDQFYVWAVNGDGMLNPIPPETIDEFKPDPSEQRKQAFLETCGVLKDSVTQAMVGEIRSAIGTGVWGTLTMNKLISEYLKVLSTINSCKTGNQISVAKTMVGLLEKKHCAEYKSLYTVCEVKAEQIYFGETV